MKNEHFCLKMSLFLLNNSNCQKSKYYKATTSYCRYTGCIFLKLPILPCSSRSNSSPVYLFHFFRCIPRLNSLPVVQGRNHFRDNFFWWLQLLVRWWIFRGTRLIVKHGIWTKMIHLEGIGLGGFFFQLAIFKFIAGILGM